MTDNTEDTKTPLHTALADAATNAEADPHETLPRRSQSGEVLDTPDVVPHGGVTTSDADDADNTSDSGNDTGAFGVVPGSDTRKGNTSLYGAHHPGGTYPQDSQPPRDYLKDRPGGAVLPPSVAGGRTSPATGTPLKTVVPGNVFQQYASTRDAADAAAQFTPKTFVSNGTSEPDNRRPQQGVRLTTLAPDFGATTDVVQDGDAIRIVGGNSASIDARAEQATYNAITDRRAAHGGGGVDLRQEIAAHDAVVAPLLGVRAAMPVRTVALDPLARVPTPL